MTHLKCFFEQDECRSKVANKKIKLSDPPGLKAQYGRLDLPGSGMVIQKDESPLGDKDNTCASVDPPVSFEECVSKLPGEVLLSLERDEKENIKTMEEAVGAVPQTVSGKPNVKCLIAAINKPVSDQSKLTVGEACLSQLSYKLDNFVRDVKFDQQQKIMSELVLGEGNMWPSSLYKQKRIIGARSADECGL